MEPVLYLVHRIPFPPNKGDKIRSYHLLRFLADRYRVYLGTFVDDAEDRSFVGELDAFTAGQCVVPLDPTRAKLRSLGGLLRGEALTLPHFRDAELKQWVVTTVREQGIRKALVFSSAMFQYVEALPDLKVVADFCDVDSAKWAQYAGQRGWPSSWVYRREGERLLVYERAAAARAAACVFVTPAEAELFARLAPECAARLHAIGNGVDTDFFRPDPGLVDPYAKDESPVVFTGAMDYWPNVDAVTWFVREVLPAVAAAHPRVRFYVVGMNPTPEVKALAVDRRVVVTGRVPDVRPYLQHARAAVVPLRVARGVQNKLLEAMAMSRPVIASPACVSALSERVRACIIVADHAEVFAQKVSAALSGAIDPDLGGRARAAAIEDYGWVRNLSRFGELLDAPASASSAESGRAVLRAPEPLLDPGLPT